MNREPPLYRSEQLCRRTRLLTQVGLSTSITVQLAPSLAICVRTMCGKLKVAETFLPFDCPQSYLFTWQLSTPAICVRSVQAM